MYFLGSAKTDLVRFKWGFGEGPLKDKFAIFEAYKSGPEKGVITKGVFSLEIITTGVSSLEKSLESLKSLKSLESLENGRNLLCLPQSGGSLETLEALNSLESLENGLFRKDPFSKRPLFPNPNKSPIPKRRNPLAKRPFYKQTGPC